MEYKYQAKDSNGNLREGLVVAESQNRAESLLAENGLIILDLELVQENLWSRIWPWGKTVPAKEMVLFSRQLATLIGAQVPILQALRILQEQVNNQNLRDILAQIVTNVESGDSLSLSLSRHPKVFGNVYVNVVHSGELSGSLDRSLNYLADQLEKDYDLNSKVRGAMVYPTFVLGALVLVGSIMFLFILPKLTDVLTEQGGALPPVTVFLIAFTKFFQIYWWFLFLLAFIAILAVRFYINTSGGRYVWDRLKIKAPIFGDIFEKIYLARFSRNLSTLIMGGIPIIKALEITSDLVNNVIYRDIILDAASKLSSGKTISSAFAGYAEIPKVVTQMIQVGEQSATLTGILGKLAAFYEKEVDNKIGNLTTLIEPIIILVLGLAVGILVAGILLPIYNLANSIQ